VELFAGAPGEQDFYSEIKGFYLQINNRSEKPLVKYSGIQIPTGFASNVEVRKEVSTSLPAPYSDCRKDLTLLSTDSIYYQYTANITIYYQYLCVDIYYQITLVVPKCGCYEANSPIYDDNLYICNSRFSASIISEFLNKKFVFYVFVIVFFIALVEIECAKNQVQFMNTPVSTDVFT